MIIQEDVEVIRGFKKKEIKMNFFFYIFWREFVNSLDFETVPAVGKSAR